MPAALLRRPLLLCALVWLSLELLLLLFRAGYPFTTLRLLDSWFYTSFQWDPVGQLTQWGHTYYASRLSLFMPGAALHAVLPPVAAAIAYKLLFTGLTVGSWAYVCLRLAGFRAALWVTIIGTMMPWFIQIRHNDYMDIGVVLYGSLTLAFTVAASTSARPWAWRLATGFAFGSMLISNLSSIAMPGCGMVLFYLFFIKESFVRRLRSAAEIAVGIGLTLALYSWLSAACGGPRWVLGTQIAALVNIGSMAKNPWAPENWQWLWNATYLVVPVCALGWGLLTLVTQKPTDDTLRRGLRALTLGHAGAMAAAFYLEIKGSGVLFHWFYAAFHLAMSVPLLALLGCLSPNERALRRVVLVGGIAAGVLIFGNWPRTLLSIASPHQLRYPPSAVCLGVGTAALLAFWPSLARLRWAAELLVVLIVLCSASQDFNNPMAGDRLRERYALVHRAYAELQHLFPKRDYQIWMDDKAIDGISLASTRMYGFTLFTLKIFPDREPSQMPTKTVVVPTLAGSGAEKLALVRARYPQIDFTDAQIVTVPGDAGLGLDLLSFRMEHREIDPENPPPGAPSYARVFDLRAEDGVSYGRHLQTVIHIFHPEPALVDGPDFPHFKRTHPHDHLTTAFFPLTPQSSREFTVVIDIAEPAQGRCVLQTQEYSDRLVLPLDRKGRFVRSVTLPNSATGVRIYFMSDTDQAITLPRRVSVYYASKP